MLSVLSREGLYFDPLVAGNVSAVPQHICAPGLRLERDDHPSLVSLMQRQVHCQHTVGSIRPGAGEIFLEIGVAVIVRVDCGVVGVVGIEPVLVLPKVG